LKARMLTVTDLEFQERMIGLIRAFGLHKPDVTPCGQPVAVADAHALMELTREEPLLQKDLASRLRLEKSTVSRLVKTLEERGWIGRKKSPHDWRAIELRLTEAGRQIAARLAETRRAKFAQVLEAIPGKERASVMQALGVLEEAMNEGG
jgi:DNA-binding MarR family transcriptional regulator